MENIDENATASALSKQSTSILARLYLFIGVPSTFVSNENNPPANGNTFVSVSEAAVVM